MTTTSITSGTDFIGKTLIIGSTGTSNSDYARVSEFNNNTTSTYLGVLFSATNKQPWFSFRPLGQMYSEPIMPWISYINVYYIYVFSFISDIQVKYNIYEYNGASTIVSKGTIGTYTGASAFLQNLTQFWLGRNIWDNDFYNGTYNKITLYNGDLFALSDANILSNLLTVVTSTQTNIINNSTTYTFRSVGTNFLGVVVNILNYNTTTGSTVTTSNITLNGTNSTIGGYLNIIGSYIGTPEAPTAVIATATNAQATINWTAPVNNGGSAITSYTVTSSPGNFQATTANGSTTTATVSGLTNGTAYTFTVVATNVVGPSASSAASTLVTPTSGLTTSNNIGSIYATTISLEKYIIIDSQNIELSGNVIMKDGLINNGLLTTNSVVPNVTNSASLGSTSKIWGNAYISDVSVNNNLQVTGNVKIGGILDVSNIYTKSQVDASFGNVYTKAQIDASFSNVYTKSQVDTSFTNVYTKSQVELSFSNVYTKASSDASFSNVYTKAYIDASFSNVYTKAFVDASLANVYTRGVIDLSFQNVYTRGQVDLSFANVYTRGVIDTSFTNVYTKGVIDTSFANVYTKSQVDVSYVSKQLFELSYNALVAIRGSGSGGTTVNTNIIPSSTNTYALGDVSKNWSNAYIRDLKVSNRVYQEISGDISWSAVNGYYGLTKHAYPALNPLSSGVKAVQTWTRRTTEDSHKWHSVCWSPELGIFVAVAYFGTNRVMTSPNGINWTPRLASELQSTQWISVCWSPQLRLFVAVGAYNGTNRVMRSIDGTTWISSTLGVESEHNWHSVCWSAELGRFLAVANGTNRVMSSRDGITWSTITAISSSAWLGVCWSKELGIFVAVSNNGIVMRSSDGINWTLGEAVPVNNWFGVCWSPELGIFVAVASGGSATRVMYSYNGTNWSNNSITGVNSNVWYSVCWSPVLNLFLAVSGNGTVMTSNNGINWTSITVLSGDWLSTCWSPELGIFAIVSQDGTSMALTSSLKGRPPTSYNVFDSSFNRIDETGKWTFTNVATTTLTVTGTFTNSSDDRLKHNEVAIVNGLAVIDRLNPKFYQKTLDLLDASYNGDLSGHSWNYEAGLIAQEVLQIPDLSFAVSGGDYYLESYNYYDTSTNNDISTNYDISANYITRANYYDISANYTISYNLIKQPYSLNYNSVFVYGVAAIKELHTKVKAQETNILDEQLNNLITRIETMETAISSPQ